MIRLRLLASLHCLSRPYNITLSSNIPPKNQAVICKAMVLSPVNGKKAWKVSSPTHSEHLPIIYTSKSSLIRQVSDEDLESSESSPKYVKSRLERSTMMLHSNERRPFSPRGVVSKQAIKMPRRGAELLIVIAAAAVFNLMRFVYYPYPSIQLPDNRNSILPPKTCSRILYLDNNYNIRHESPYLHHPTEQRKTVNVYPAEQTDETQLYGTTSSNDVRVQGMEKRFFPMHETNKNCIPMSEWQYMTFRK
eukprot:scaffold286965_cov93-Cyclotella_meneghiniana.AAC.3